MQYFDQNKLESIDADAFSRMDPYPCINPAGLLTEEAWQHLREHLPDLSALSPSFGRSRYHGQASHDRYVLEYDPGLRTVHPAWHEFVSELNGPVYRRFLQRMCGRKSLRLNMHWHYTPRGCSVSPHCDALHKLGSHIFYFNDKDDWDEAWGGQTLVLDDGGRFKPGSAPGFDDFDRIISSTCMGNYSTFFIRRNRSWHGVRELTCPEGSFRKVFIVVINNPVLYRAHRVLNRLKGKK